MSRCFSLTKLECDGDNVGKFNRNNAGTISNCYYADTVSGEGNYFQDGIGIAEKIESELLSAEFLTDEFYWNSNYWQFDAEGATAPKLLWEV